MSDETTGLNTSPGGLGGTGQPPEAAAPEAEPQESAAERIQQLERELEEHKARVLRLAADLENYKRRAQRERDEISSYASQALLTALIPALDDLHLAIDHATDAADEGWVRGARLAVKKLEDAMAAAGVSKIESVSRPFDPALHEAVGVETRSDLPDGTVIDELRAGYRLHDRVIRPATVRIARRDG